MKRKAKNIRTRSKSPVDLTGKRFGKWTVLEYAGQRIRCYRGEKFLTRMWLCRCDCGVQKEVRDSNLTGGRSTKCQRCGHTKHGRSSIAVYDRWCKLRQSGQLSKEWRDFDVFRKAVGDPPEKNAHLVRIDLKKPCSSQNFFWMCPGRPPDSPTSVKRIRELRRAAMEEHIANDTMLMRIRNAKSNGERNRRMITARKAGYSFALIGMAARVTRQRAQAIISSGGC